MQIAYLLTGGNTGDSQQYLAEAVTAIQKNCGAITAKSALYETAAWGLEEQPPFLNQAIELATALNPQELLACVLAIEIELGRVRQLKYGPRTIDIDILFFGGEIIQETGLTIPHPHLQDRRFALQCLHDIAPAFIHPVFQKTIHTLLQECTDSLTVYKLP